MPDLDVINTTVSSRQRTISLLLDTGETARFALLRRPNGDVGWVLDYFTRVAPGAALDWSGHHGHLSVTDVVARLPHCTREIVRWTREEIEDGADAYDVDIFSRDARRRALERLAAELALIEQAA